MSELLVEKTNKGSKLQWSRGKGDASLGKFAELIGSKKAQNQSGVGGDEVTRKVITDEDTWARITLVCIPIFIFLIFFFGNKCNLFFKSFIVENQRGGTFQGERMSYVRLVAYYV